MRLGEIKQKIDRVVNENRHIVLDQEDLYGGQAKLIKNYADVIEVINYISTLDWSDVKKDEVVNDLLSKYPVVESSQILPQEEFNKLNSYVSRINQKLLLYYAILETMVEKQDEKVINIKLPGKLKSFKDLNDANKRIEEILKLYNVDGQFEFIEFDKGTNWYVVMGVGVLSYRFLITGLNIAQKYLDTRKTYWESKKAKLDYQACLGEKEELTPDGLNAYMERRMKLLIQDEIESAILKIGAGSNNTNELQTKLIQATTKLIAELGEGTEFHLSLNPPEYASEHSGKLVIDYKKIQALKPAEKQKVIDSPKIKTGENAGEKTNEEKS